jgi:hypothetical protein
MRSIGLENNYGEHNCWINVAIQPLFHLEDFRNAIENTENHLLSGIISVKKFKKINRE